MNYMVSVLTLLTASASCTRARERGVGDSWFVCSYLVRYHSECLDVYLFVCAAYAMLISPVRGKECPPPLDTVSRAHEDKGSGSSSLSGIIRISHSRGHQRVLCWRIESAALRLCALRLSCSSLQRRSGADRAGFSAAEMQSFASLHRKRRPARSLSSQTSQAVNV